MGDLLLLLCEIRCKPAWVGVGGRKERVGYTTSWEGAYIHARGREEEG